MDASAFATLVHSLQISVITSLIFLAGLSSCLSLWVIPFTALLPPQLAVRQFSQTFAWGGQYLQPLSRLLGTSLLLTSVLTSFLSNPVEAAKWKVWASCFVFLIGVAPYETYLIFPINNRAEEIGRELDGGVEGKREDELKRELRGLLGMWQRRNFG